MCTEYEIVNFDHTSEVDVKELEQFIADAEIVISNFGVAWSKIFIEKVGYSLRGATLEFKDGTMTHGYNVESKLVGRKK